MLFKLEWQIAGGTRSIVIHTQQFISKKKKKKKIQVFSNNKRTGHVVCEKKKIEKKSTPIGHAFPYTCNKNDNPLKIIIIH